MLFEGSGVPRDDRQAARWMELAAVQGFALAQHNLGLAYMKGRDVRADIDTAAKWIQLAAHQGLAAAEEKLGSLHELGRGVGRDEVAAYMWYSLALSHGQASAEGRRAELAKRMSAMDVAHGVELSRMWQDNIGSPVKTGGEGLALGARASSAGR